MFGKTEDEEDLINKINRQIENAVDYVSNFTNHLKSKEITSK